MAKKVVAFLMIIEIMAVSFVCGRVSAKADIPNITRMVYAENSDASEAEKIANTYLSTGTYSKDGLVTALITYEHFSKDAANEAVESLNVDWQEQAEKEVEAYLHMDGISEKRLREYMKREEFTDAQTEKAIQKVNPDWSEQAHRRAEVLREAGIDSVGIRPTLLEMGFTENDLTAYE